MAPCAPVGYVSLHAQNALRARRRVRTSPTRERPDHDLNEHPAGSLDLAARGLPGVRPADGLPRHPDPLLPAAVLGADADGRAAARTGAPDARTVHARRRPRRHLGAHHAPRAQGHFAQHLPRRPAAQRRLGHGRDRLRCRNAPLALHRPRFGRRRDHPAAGRTRSALRRQRHLRQAGLPLRRAGRQLRAPAPGKLVLGRRAACLATVFRGADRLLPDQRLRPALAAVHHERLRPGSPERSVRDPVGAGDRPRHRLLFRPADAHLARLFPRCRRQAGGRDLPVQHLRTDPRAPLRSPAALGRQPGQHAPGIRRLPRHDHLGDHRDADRPALRLPLPRRHLVDWRLGGRRPAGHHPARHLRRPRAAGAAVVARTQGR